MIPWRKILGVGLIFLGIIALITPFTPGAWLIIVGLGVLGVEIAIEEDHWFAAWARRFGIKIKKKIKERKMKHEEEEPASEE
jgi:hypothetical protein